MGLRFLSILFLFVSVSFAGNLVTFSTSGETSWSGSDWSNVSSIDEFCKPSIQGDTLLYLDAGNIGGRRGVFVPAGGSKRIVSVTARCTAAASGNCSYDRPFAESTVSSEGSRVECFAQTSWDNCPGRVEYTNTLTFSCTATFELNSDCTDPNNSELCGCFTTSAEAEAQAERERQSCLSDSGAVANIWVTSDNCVAGICNDCGTKKIVDLAKNTCCGGGRLPTSNWCSDPPPPTKGVLYSSDYENHISMCSSAPSYTCDFPCDLYEEPSEQLACECARNPNSIPCRDPSSSSYCNEGEEECGSGGSSDSSSDSGGSSSSGSGFCTDPANYDHKICVCERDPGAPGCEDPFSSGSGGSGSSGSGGGGYCEDNPDSPLCKSSGSGGNGSSNSEGCFYWCDCHPDDEICKVAGPDDYCDTHPSEPYCEWSRYCSQNPTNPGCVNPQSPGTLPPPVNPNGGGGGGSGGDDDEDGDGPGDAACFRTATEANYAYVQFKSACKECKGHDAFFVNSTAYPGWHCVFGNCFGCEGNNSPGGTACHSLLAEAQQVFASYNTACAACRGKSSYTINSTAYPGWYCIVGECAGCQSGAGSCDDSDLNAVEKILCDLSGGDFGDTTGLGAGGEWDGGELFGTGDGDTTVNLGNLDTNVAGFLGGAAGGIKDALATAYAPVLNIIPAGECTCSELFVESAESGNILKELVSKTKSFLCTSGLFGFDVMKMVAGFIKVMAYLVCLTWAIKFFE